MADPTPNSLSAWLATPKVTLILRITSVVLTAGAAAAGAVALKVTNQTPWIATAAGLAAAGQAIVHYLPSASDSVNRSAFLHLTKQP